MSNSRVRELWRAADEMEQLGRMEPLIVGSVGQPVLNRNLREAQRLREEARRAEGRSRGRGDTPVSAQHAERSDLVGLASALDAVTTECRAAGRLALRIRQHLDLVNREVMTPPTPCRNPNCDALLPPVYRTSSPGRRRVYCSDSCRAAAHPKPPEAQRGLRPCEFCGWTFMGNHAGHRFCDPRCAAAARGLDQGLRISCDRFSVILWQECRDCGETWPSTFAQNTRCPDCQVVHRRAVKQMRNAFRRGAPTGTGEVITDLEIFERDGWVCRLCGDPVLPFIRCPHPRSASIDHIVPVSQGGQHVALNLQLAHFGCNSAKRDRMVPCHSEGASTSSLPAAPSGCVPGPSATSAAPGGSGAETPTVLSPAA